SIGSIVKVALVILLIYLLYMILDILGLLFVSVVVAAALGPWVDSLQRYRIPRAVSLIVIYLAIFLIISLVVFLLIPPLVQQIQQLASALPNYYIKAVSGLSAIQHSSDIESAATIRSFLENIGATLASTANSIFSTVTSIFGGLIQLVVILVISFYLIVQENGLKRFLRSITPAKYQPYIMQLMSRINIKLGLWFRAQLLLMLIIGVLTYIGLKLFGMEYALVLALWAGLTEIIPYIGPIIGALPAVFLAFTISPIQGLLIIVLYVIVQQLENNIIVPTIMRKAVGLNPIISIVVILVGVKLGGIMGAILSIPLATAIAVFVSDFFEGWQTSDQKLETEETTSDKIP
ncbi:MAG: AI-2E family transporter, partial [Patescibacteria group bacterium]